jgi:energy-converting hydrogenase Eha subunit C
MFGMVVVVVEKTKKDVAIVAALDVPCCWGMLHILPFLTLDKER